MEKSIISVTQLPIIVEKLQQVKAEVTKRAEKATNLVCSEENVKYIKTIRADLNKDFCEYEERRKEVKKAILSPYEKFEVIYKDCVSDVFRKADAELKAKINAVENELKDKKTAEVQFYFDEYLASKNIPIEMNIYDCKLNITLSASLKSLKEKVKATIDRVCEDLAVIDTQEYKDEILYEYKQNLNISNSITTVINRHKAIEESKPNEELQQAQAELKQKAAEKVESLLPPTVEKKEITVSFNATATISKLKLLKEYMNREGIRYE